MCIIFSIQRNTGIFYVLRILGVQSFPLWKCPWSKFLLSFQISWGGLNATDLRSQDEERRGHVIRGDRMRQDHPDKGLYPGGICAAPIFREFWGSRQAPRRLSLSLCYWVIARISGLTLGYLKIHNFGQTNPPRITPASPSTYEFAPLKQQLLQGRAQRLV